MSGEEWETVDLAKHLFGAYDVAVREMPNYTNLVRFILQDAFNKLESDLMELIGAW